MQPDQGASAPAESDSVETKYLLFKLADELYATPIGGIRQVIKPPFIKSMPFMKRHFLGVTNYQGRLVSVIDLRRKFELQANDDSASIVLIVGTQAGPVAAVVDTLVSVTDIPPGDIDSRALVETRIPVEFFLGIAKTSAGLANLIDIAGTLSAEDFKTIQETQEKAS